MGVFAHVDTPSERSPPERLTDAHACADVFQLLREGLLVEGVSASLETAHGRCLLSVRTAGILELDGQPIRIVWHKALPLKAFRCPKCGTDRYRLHRVKGVWACRLCPWAQLREPPSHAQPRRAQLSQGDLPAASNRGSAAALHADRAEADSGQKVLEDRARNSPARGYALRPCGRRERDAGETIWPRSRTPRPVRRS
jgi:hypothetical protein